MRLKITIAVIIAYTLFSSCSLKTTTSGAIESSSLNNGKGAYATKKYRNLFKENGHTDQEINGKVANAFKQLFHGDSATQKIYFPAGKNANGPEAYILDV